MHPNTIKAIFGRSNANPSFDDEKSIFSMIRNKLGWPFGLVLLDVELEMLDRAIRQENKINEMCSD